MKKKALLQAINDCGYVYTDLESGTRVRVVKRPLMNQVIRFGPEKFKVTELNGNDLLIE